MNDIEAIAFDLEGTLVDVEIAHHEGHLEVAAELGLHLSLEEARRKVPGFIGGGDPAIAKSLRLMSSTLRTEDEILTALKTAYWKRLLDTPIAARPGVVDFIEQLRERQLSFALGSLTPRKEGEFLLESAGIKQLFAKAPIIFREEVSRVKPSPDVYLATARALKVEPRRQLVFEDSPIGVQAAVTAGSSVIAIPSLDDRDLRIELLASGAIRVVLDWRELQLNNLLV